MKLIRQPSNTDRLGETLVRHLGEPWKRFRAAVAFAKRSGTQHIAPALRAFVASGRQAELLVGVDHRGTSQEALEELLAAVSPPSRVVICHNNLPFTTFHPKLYLFSSPTAAELLVGSGNFTEGGLFTNCEA
ncbi:MAG: phospholipase D family protein, partial [Pseudomonadota bacterium]